MEKLRTEKLEKDKWDLAVIYPNDTEWMKDYEIVKSLIPNLKKYQNNLIDANTLYEALNEYHDILRKSEKIYMYAHLFHDADTGNITYQEYNSMAINLINEINTISSYIKPELLKNDYKVIENFYITNPKLLEYKKTLEDIFNYKNHTLSGNEERLIAAFNKVTDAPGDIYEILTDTDFTFDDIILENGEKLPLNGSNYHTYLLNKDEVIRQQAFNNMYKTYENHINTLAATMYNNVSSDCLIARIRNYPNAISASLNNDDVNVEVYDNLISVVNENLGVLYKYYKLKADVLKLPILNIYDIYLNLINENNKKYSFSEAKNIVLESLAILGSDYQSVLNKAFDERWIDIYPSKGKRSGAYSSGSYETYPYILLNYEGELGDVSTLAHELGHSVHSYYSRTSNSYQNSDYKIFVAEVASTVNELLMCKHLIKTSTDKNTKLSILNKMLELFKGTIFRQTMFAEFEKETHKIVDNGGVLTRGNLCDMYLDINKKYFGDEVNVLDNIKYEWARIPHFYYNFYVYKYATGLSAACYIVNNILNNEGDSLNKYLEFLKTGGTMNPLDELKIAGVDMKNKEVIESAIKMFDETIEEFMNVYNS